MRISAVYYDSTYRHDGAPCCTSETGLHLKERTDAEVEGRWGADNGMYYWRARRSPDSPADSPRWSTWRAHEPGTVVTQAELYWDADHPDGPVYAHEDLAALQAEVVSELQWCTHSEYEPVRNVCARCGMSAEQLVAAAHPRKPYSLSADCERGRQDPHWCTRHDRVFPEGDPQCDLRVRMTCDHFHGRAGGHAGDVVTREYYLRQHPQCTAEILAP